MISSKSLNMNNLYFASVDSDNPIEFNGKVETINCYTDKEEERAITHRKGWFSIDFSMPTLKKASTIDRFIKDCNKNIYSYNDIKYLLENRMI